MPGLHELKEVVGSLLVLGFEGLRVTDSLHNFLTQWNLGGVILFKRNIQSISQLVELNKSFYDLSRHTPLVSVDHEGGRVFRLPSPFTVFPPMRRVGDRARETQNPDLARQVGRMFGLELRAAGFNVDYAPVLDVDSNPQNPIIGDRAFATQPEEAAQAALAFAEGLQAEGVLACGKHFPGHGDTIEDSHHTLPCVDKDRESLEACEWLPFRRAIARRIPLLMTAHVLYPALDAEWPATLSRKILTDLLRHDMGYQGFIISDDFFMQGIAARWDLGEAVERFFRAGGDIALLCHQEAVQRRIAAHLVHVAERDAGFCQLLQEKSARVQALRLSLSRPVDADKLHWVGCEAHQVAAAEFAETTSQQ